MRNGKIFHTLIQNVSKAVESHGPRQLNTVIEEMMSGSEIKPEIEYLLTIVADEYGISKRILKKARAVGNLKQARNVAYCILHYRLKLSSRHIAIRVFGHKAHHNVWEAINKFVTLNDKVKTDKEFKQKYDICDTRFVEFIKNYGTEDIQKK